ncbi:hypothetical protein NVP1209O_24 [Vibrio phage 1.209.O._10N.222.52.B2]|nr:hypothetical protein NVP1209O_24 [Vibrio phage 1.209.O._10N.222.52.B2]
MQPDKDKQALHDVVEPTEPVNDFSTFRDIIDTGKIGSKPYRDYLNGQTSIIQGSGEDEQAIALLDEQADAEASLKLETGNYYARQRQQVDQAIMHTLNTSPSTLTQAVEDGMKGHKAINETEASVIAVEQAYVNQVAPNSFDEILRNEAVFNMAVTNKLASLTEEQGWTDTALDIGSYFFSLGTAKDINDISKEVEKNPELAFLAGGDLETIATKFKALPIEARTALLDPLIDAVQEATKTSVLGFESDGNMLKTVSFVRSLLSAEGGERLKTERNIEAVLGTIDVLPAGTIAKALTKAKPVEKVMARNAVADAVDSAIRGNNRVHVAANAGDVDSAAVHNINALSSEEAARRAGMTRQVAGLNWFPHQTQAWAKEVTNGVSPEIQKQFNAVVTRASGFARQMKHETELIQIGALSKSERKSAVQNFEDNFGKLQEDYLNEGIFLENLKIGKVDKDGFTYQYTVRNEFDPVADVNGKPHYKLHTGTTKFRVSDVTGTFTATATDPVAQSAATNILSPAAWSKGEFNQAVQRAIVASDLSAGYAKQVGDMMLWAIEPVKGLKNTKARGRIEDILQAGDEFINPHTQTRGRVFTLNELSAGVETSKGTVKLTAPNEVEAYYRTRMLADTFYQQQNGLVRRELELGGFSNVNLLGGTSKAIAKPMDTVESAVLSIKDKPGYRVFDEAQGRTINLDEATVRAEYEKGNYLVRMRKDWNSNGKGDLARDGEFVEYAFVSKEQISTLPEQVLEYRRGYVPKINKAEFFVSKELPIIKAGAPGARNAQAVRAFNSRTDAEAFREAQIEKFVQNNKDTFTRAEAESFFKIGGTTDLNRMNRLEEAVSSGSGLYTGTRAADDIVFGLTGTKLERVSPLEAFQRNVQHLGKALARNELRVGEEKRWLNTVRKVLPDVRIEGFNGTKLPDTKEGRALEAIRRTVNEWNTIPETEETLFSGTMQRIHDLMLNGTRKLTGYKNKDSIHSLLYFKHASPFQAMKAANMHVMLGVLNPAQIYVQASAAVVALSRNFGTNLGKVASDDVFTAFKFAQLDNIRNPEGLRKSVKEMIKDGQVSGVEAEAYEAFRKSGLYESVYNNADTAYMQGSGFGASMKVMNDVSTVSLMFYRAGEMFNRRYSFIKAYASWKKKHPTAKPDDDQMIDIVGEANQSMLELNSANRAWWQGGAGTSTARQTFGMTTQFLQVIAKTMELAIKNTGRGGWTNAEKARILTGQVLLFGSAGVPLFNAAPGAIANWLGIEVDAERANVINQGIVGAVVGNLVGADVDVANRAALGGQILSTMRDLFMSDEPLYIKGAGVSGETISRFFGAIDKYSLLMTASRAGQVDLSGAQMKAAAVVLGEIPSSIRNISKAYMMHNFDRIYDRRSRPITEDKFNLQTEIAAGLGFRPTQETRTRMLQLTNRDFQELAQDIANERIYMWHQWFKVHGQSKEYGEIVSGAMQMQDEVMDNPALELAVRNIIGNRIWDGEGETIQDRELQKFIKTIGLDEFTEGFTIDRGVIDSKAELGIFQPFQETLGSEK